MFPATLCGLRGPHHIRLDIASQRRWRAAQVWSSSLAGGAHFMPPMLHQEQVVVSENQRLSWLARCHLKFELEVHTFAVRV